MRKRRLGAAAIAVALMGGCLSPMDPLTSEQARGPGQLLLSSVGGDAPADTLLCSFDDGPAREPHLALYAGAEDPAGAAGVTRGEGDWVPVPRANGSYSVLPDVQIPQNVEQKIAKVADVYHQRTGKRLVVTSGTRGPTGQAKAMFALLDLGTDIVGLYKHKSAAEEIQGVYASGKARAQDEATIVKAMAETIRRQMARGVYISAHLRAGAVDVRNRNMTDADKRAFAAGVSLVGDISVLEEASPPHFHLEVD